MSDRYVLHSNASDGDGKRCHQILSRDTDGGYSLHLTLYPTTSVQMWTLNLRGIEIVRGLNELERRRARDRRAAAARRKAVRS